jgi:ATP-dependent helicase HrpA
MSHAKPSGGGRRIHFPAELPISARRDDVGAAIRDHQVVVITGETGSGKTTQLPKICLDLGYGERGRIGHTQPRRLAARTVAERIAEELGESIGDTVGFQVRFTERVGEHTRIKVMTDGILLNEIQRDRMLRAYDVLIIDEAHERGLNIDFILGYLKRLLPRRPDLKLIITSATIDPERFARHFGRGGSPPRGEHSGDAPVIEVSGRTYPVELRYRPLVDPDRPTKERDQVQGIVHAVDELTAEGRGDILVFCSGEREIRDAADALRSRRLRDTEVLPLYARLSAAEQHRVFERHRGRRIVLATNIAETSLTVPGIRYVIDPGTARISRYSQRLKVQRLPIEPVSQASANQRAGRCGRTSDGICIRLYSEEDYESRPAFTEPEILRTNLASVLLAMIDLGLGDLADFPFLDPPDRRNVRAGLDLLVELGALAFDRRPDRPRRLTKIGKRLARLPLDPRLGRMVLEADRNGALREVLIIVAALSIQDPRERPADHEAAADAQHARFADPESDFAAYLSLWSYLRERRRELSGNQFRRMCRDEYLHYLRVREWQDVHAQLVQITRDLGMRRDSTAAAPVEVTKSLLAGLLSHVGLRDPDARDYLGARGARFAVFPGSGLFRKPPQWVMSAELVETSRLWARENARIDPAWAESLAGHLVKRTYSEPHWERKRGAVMAYEKVTLYGVPLAERRPVTYSKIDPERCRELFIRHALVEGDWQTRHGFFQANRALLDEVEELEDRIRRRDLRVDDETLFEFYDERIGDEVVSAAHFETWWKRVRRDQPNLLDFERALVMPAEAEPDAIAGEFPDEWRHDDTAMPLTYVFDPGSRRDGVTVDVPLAQLNQLDADEFWWQVPGHREELVTELIRSLPKQWRRQLVPAPDHARAVVEHLYPGRDPLPVAVATQLRRLTGVDVPADAFDYDKIPDHLRLGFRVVDGDTVVAEGKDLDQLRDELRPRLRSALSDAAARVEHPGMTAWEIDDLPREVTARQGRHDVRGYPALVDEGDRVAVRVLESPHEQGRAMRRGTRRLLLLSIGSPATAVARRLDNRAKLSLAASPYPSVPALLNDCAGAAIDDLVATAGGPAWDRDGFGRLRDLVRAELHDVTYETTTVAATSLDLAATVRRRLDQLAGDQDARHVLDDMRAQLSWLVHDGFVAETGRAQLAHVPRYLRAMTYRLDRLAADAARDDQRMLEVQAVEDDYDRLVDGLPPHRRDDADVTDVRWSIEELRVSLFAQALGTARPVSAKRLRAAIAAIRP